MDELELKLSMEQSLANKFERQLKEETERRKFAEAELALIKGIEPTELHKKVQKLKKELDETRKDNTKLAEQINDYVNKLRKAGVI